MRNNIEEVPRWPDSIILSFAPATRKSCVNNAGQRRGQHTAYRDVSDVAWVLDHRQAAITEFKLMLDKIV